MATWGEDDSFEGAFTFGSVAVKSNASVAGGVAGKNAVKSNAGVAGGVSGKRGMSPERGNARKRSRVSSSPRGQI